MLQITEKMEAEGASSGVVVTVVGGSSDAPTSTNYQITPMTEIAGAMPAAGSSPAPAVQVGPHPPPVLSLKKKRGRPRKYGPDGSVTVALSPKPISMSAPASVIDFSAQKRPKIKPTAAAAAPAPARAVPKPYQPKVEVDNIGGLLSPSVGANFTPHFITVHAGEDVTMKIMSFSQQGPRAICVLSANGAISSVTLRHPESSGGTLTYEGRFEILSLTGSFMPSESGGFKNRTGGMSVSLAGPDGRVVGGGVAGLLVAAGTVQIVVGSFLAGNQQEPTPKKQKSEYIISGPPSSTVNFSTGGAQEGYGGQRHHASNTTYPSFHGETRNGSADHDDSSYHEG